MIGRIQGQLLEKTPPDILVDVGGVGYEIHVPMSTFYDLPSTGELVVLKTHLAVREDAHTLYGFGSEHERELFRILIKISGVGAKLALAILSGMSVTEFTQLIQSRDAQALVKLPGVGKKTAERLVVELTDKLGGMESSENSPFIAQVDPENEARDALLALGYKPPEVARLIKSVATESLSSEEIIRQALQGSIR